MNQLWLLCSVPLLLMQPSWDVLAGENGILKHLRMLKALEQKVPNLSASKKSVEKALEMIVADKEIGLASDEIKDWTETVAKRLRRLMRDTQQNKVKKRWTAWFRLCWGGQRANAASELGNGSGANDDDDEDEVSAEEGEEEEAAEDDVED